MQEELLREILAELKKDNKIKEKVTLTIEECAEYMGVAIGKVTELINKENTDFPYFKNNSKFLVNRHMLDKWLEMVTLEHRQI